MRKEIKLPPSEELPDLVVYETFCARCDETMEAKDRDWETRRP